jgi:sugar lactone lactonase YvrE
MTPWSGRRRKLSALATLGCAFWGLLSAPVHAQEIGPVRTVVMVSQHGTVPDRILNQKVTFVRSHGRSSKARTSSPLPTRSKAAAAKTRGAAAHPRGNGPNGGTPVNAQNFGSVAVGGTPVTLTLTYAAPSSGTLSAAVTEGVDFTAQTPACSAGQCTVAVTFTPLFPGLLQDALTLTDGNGNNLYLTFLYGTGTAPQFGFDLGDLTVYLGYSSAPYSITVGPDKNVYYTDRSEDLLYQCPPGLPGCTSYSVTGLGTPAGLAVDGNSTVYVVDQSNNLVRTYNIPSGTQGVLTTSMLSAPTGVAVDGAGNVYIADTGNGRILQESTQGTETVLVSGLMSPTSLALDSAGDLFFADAGSAGEIQELVAGTTTPMSIETSLGTLEDIAVDAAGRIYASTPGGDTLIAPGQSTVGYGGGANYGMFVDQQGNVYTTQPASGNIAITNRSASNFILNTQVDTTTQGGDTISNTGNMPLALSSLTITESPFTFDQSSQCAAGQSIAPAQTCGLAVDFSPTATGYYQATITATSNSLNAAGTTDQDAVAGTATGYATSTTLSAPATVAAGQQITFAATVAVTAGGADSAPTGTVQFLDGTTVLGSPALNASTGQATYTTSSLTTGPHSITAVYSGDSLYATSSSPAQTVTVTPSSSSPPATSTISLTIAPASVSYRSSVALTATVLGANGAPVTTGQVIFCLASATHCTPELSLAIAQLTPQGSAVAKLSPGTIGVHSYQAVFLGTTTAAKSVSTAASVTVTGIYPTTTQIAATGSPGSYTLTGTVVGTGTAALAPTGSVTFQDTTAATVAGSAALGAAVLSFSEIPSNDSPVTVGSYPYGVATADFNGDGFVDLVVQNYGSANISVLLGNGDGTFQPQVTYAVGDLPERVLTADVNGDGIPDLVVANTGGSSISILLGNGDGTFQPQVTYAASSPVGLGVLDLNHDGIVDIVAADYYSNTVSVLLGNGDGTFQAAVTYATGSTPQTLAEGDFNGDGNVDLVVGNLNDNTVGVFLGKGDGTFQPQITYPVGSQPQGVQVGDFNGDGIDDLAVANNGSNTVSVLIGNGDGTFQPQVTYPVGTGPVGIVIADFNGDGISDISVNNAGSLTQGVLLGNGDGTFAAATSYPTGNFPYGVAAADFNGDGLPDLAISNFNDGTATILLSQLAQTATASVSGVNISGAAGPHLIDASYAGDANFSGGTSPTYPITVSNAVISPGGSTTVPNGGVAPGSPTDYTFFGNMNVEFGGSGGGQPTNLTNFSVSTLKNVEYPGNGNYTTITAPGGTTPFTTGTVTDNPPNYPNTTPHTSLLATFSPLKTGTITVYILDGNTDGVYVGNSTVGLGVNGGAEIATPSHASSGTNEFTAYTVTGAQPSDVFQVYATTSTNAYPTIGALTFSVPVASLASSTATLTANPSTQTVGGDVSFSVAVAGVTQTSPVPTGVVTLTNTSVTPNTTVGTITLGASGTGSVVISTLPSGTNAIVATYGGDSVYAASTSASQTVTITSPLSLASISPNGGVVGSPATTITLTGANFSTTDVVQLNGTPVASTYVSSTQLTAVIPASFFAATGTANVTVHDTASGATSGPVVFTVASTPQILFSGPSTAASGQQPSLTFQLVNPYPIPLAGVLILSFAPATSTGIDDPAVQFSSGGRSIDFNIPANSTATPTVQLQTGTVAGTATVALTVTANGVDVTPSNVAPVVITIPAAVPFLSLSSPSLTRNGLNLIVNLVGFSNTREVTKATFHFNAQPGTTISNPDVTVDVSSDFTGWFSAAASDTYGSEFTYIQNFTLSEDSSIVSSVTVTLLNTVGQSTVVTVQ